MVGMYPKQNPFQAASINIASYTILWSMPTRVYVCPSITSVMDPSEITSDPTHKSRRPASWNLFPMVDIGGFKWYGMECYHSEYNVIELIILPTSKWFLQSWHRRLGRRRRHSPLVPGSPWYSEFVSGLHWPLTSRLMGCWLLTGSPQYPAPQACQNVADMRMLNPVQLLMAWSSSGFDIRVSKHLKFLTWHPGPVCLGSLYITLWHWSDDSGLHSHAIDPVRCALSTDRLLWAVYIVPC